MKLPVVVLMAGEGQRFKNKGYKTPKPLVIANGKTILEWTTSSLPFLQNNSCRSLTFAIQKKHNENLKLEKNLEKIYGSDISIVKFDHLTNGNLETAYKSIDSIAPSRPILFLDSDNKYNGSGFLEFVSKIPEDDFAVICCFNPLDKSEKWCFAKMNKNNKVLSLSEKKKIPGGYPMVGVFYFSSKRLFVNIATKIFYAEEKVKGEYYMSQAVSHMIYSGVPVYGFKVSGVVPLGTPEDLENFENRNL